MSIGPTHRLELGRVGPNGHFMAPCPTRSEETSFQLFRERALGRIIVSAAMLHTIVLNGRVIELMMQNAYLEVREYFESQTEAYRVLTTIAAEEERHAIRGFDGILAGLPDTKRWTETYASVIDIQLAAETRLAGLIRSACTGGNVPAMLQDLEAMEMSLANNVLYELAVATGQPGAFGDLIRESTHHASLVHSITAGMAVGHIRPGPPRSFSMPHGLNPLAVVRVRDV